MKCRAAFLFGILAFLLICFIWGQSMLPKEQSAAESSRLMEIIKPLLDPRGRIDDSLFHHYLRKAAHFTEYAALGFCLGGFFRNLVWKRRNHSIPAVILASAAVASSDELIQVFSADRGPQLRDVLLDIGGAVFGLLVFLLFAKIIALCRRGKQKKAADRQNV